MTLLPFAELAQPGSKRNAALQNAGRVLRAPAAPLRGLPMAWGRMGWGWGSPGALGPLRPGCLWGRDPDGQGVPRLGRRVDPLRPRPDLWARVLARIYDPELLFISSGSRRFGWEVFQFPPGLDQTAQISKGEMRSPLLRALRARGVLQARSRLLPAWRGPDRPEGGDSRPLQPCSSHAHGGAMTAFPSCPLCVPSLRTEQKPSETPGLRSRLQNLDRGWKGESGSSPLACNPPATL